MAHRAPDTHEEAAAKLPALHVLMAMGQVYLSPKQAMAMRSSERVVLLGDVLRARLAEHRFDYKGQRYPLSTSGIDHVIREISSTGLCVGCRPRTRRFTST